MLLHQAQPLAGVESVLHHVRVAGVEVAQHAQSAADMKERDRHHAHRRLRVRSERGGDSRDSRTQPALGDADRLRETGRAAGEQDKAVAIVHLLGDRDRAGVVVEKIVRRECFAHP